MGIKSAFGLSEDQKEDSYGLYRDFMAALTTRRSSTVVAYAVLGSVLSQCVELAADGDGTAMHALVDQFAKAAHQLVDDRIARPSAAT